MNDTLPISRQAEEAVIGSVLINPDSLQTIELDVGDFYIHRHKAIWSAIEELAAESITPDYITLIDTLEKQNNLDDVGGAAYLTQLINIVPSSLRGSEYADIVRNMARRRSLIQLASDIAKTAYDKKSDLDAGSAQFISELVQVSRVQSGAVHWEKHLGDLWEDVRRRNQSPGDIWGIPTGLDRFDKLTGGLQQGELLVISGEPGVGKSILAMQMAANMAVRVPGAIYSLEMGGLQATRRLVSARGQIETRKLKTGRLTGDDWSTFVQAIDYLSQLPVYLSDAPTWTTSGLRADLARLKAQHGIQWFVVDYLYLMSSRGENEIERTSATSKGLVQICKPGGLDLAGIAIHSMRKAGMDAGVPQQQDLRGSGQVTYDADLICFLTSFKPQNRDDRFLSPEEQANLRTLFFSKGRELEDPHKYLHLVKRPGFPAFGDYIPDQSQKDPRPIVEWIEGIPNY